MSSHKRKHNDDPASSSSYQTLLSTFNNKQVMKQMKRKMRKLEREQQSESVESITTTNIELPSSPILDNIENNNHHHSSDTVSNHKSSLNVMNDPFATIVSSTFDDEDDDNKTKNAPLKSFSSEKQAQCFADLTKDVKNRQIVNIDFQRRMNDAWFTHFYKPYTEDELNEMIDQFNDVDRNEMHLFEEGASHSNQVYKSLGNRVQYNVHKHLPVIHEDVSVDKYCMERDVMKLWKARVLMAQESVDHLRPDQFFKNNFQQAIFSIVNDYRDLYFSGRNSSNAGPLLESLVLHTANHMVKKKRYQILNQKMREVMGEEHYVVRDGTLNPTTILFLVPFRSTAYKIVNLLLELLPKIPLENVNKLDAFEYLFSQAAEENEDDDEEEDGEQEGAKQKSRVDMSKPEWWRSVFDGNVDDQFVLPLKFDLLEGNAEVMCKTSESDIIIATPVALMAENKNDKFQTFLSSIEIVNVIDADVMLMQNWEHMISSFELLNLSPSQSKRTTFSVDWPTLKTPLLYEKAPYFRQNIITSRYMTPDINSLMQYCNNLRGIVKVRNVYPGVVSKGKGSVLQIFERYDCKKLRRDSDKRHEYFVNQVFPRFKKSSTGRFIIVVSSYLDYVRVRNYFNSERIQFFGLSEYTENTRNQLSKFRKEETRYMLYTERHFYYHAPKLKEFKVNQIFFYSLPENDFIYQAFVERAGAIAKSYEACRVLSLYSTFDALKLERIVGTERCKPLLTDDQNVHLIQK